MSNQRKGNVIIKRGILGIASGEVGNLKVSKNNVISIKKDIGKNKGSKE